MILILSSSLSTDSNSRILAREAERVLATEGQETRLLDLRDFPLPWCDGEAAYAHPHVAVLNGYVREAAAIVVAAPIYNYDVSAALKNVIELTGRSWEDKVVGFLCAAGGPSSYMSIMSLANSLMLDFRSVIVPRFVYATGAAFAEGVIQDADVRNRVATLVRVTLRLAGGISAGVSAVGR